MTIFCRQSWAFALYLLGSAAAADTSMPNDEERSFWRGGDQGWFFYNEAKVQEPEVPAPPPEPEPEPTTQAKVTEPPAPPPAPESKAEPPKMLSAEWFRENLPKYRDAAWDNPTVENVQAFLYLQRFAMDRSEQFSDAAELATLGHPWLDESNRRPTASAAANRLARQAVSKRNAALDALSERAGVFFFYDSQCSVCAEMVGVIQMLQNDFAVIPISMDGKDLPGDPFPDFRADDGHAEKIGVQDIPSLYLASPDGEFAPFAQGPISLDDARHRMIVASRRMNWITDDEFNATRPVRNLHRDLSEQLVLDDVITDNETNFVPPEEILERINQEIGGPAIW